ncbi:hypothetical protein [Terribacillus aidingensis]|uniref:hypothetical protein n=1 Tax=Terribacillus aidingensis TaxID=586416 RepID=UPI000BE38A25|nr:hypothetical protein [Terribacillus aidingensis]
MHIAIIAMKNSFMSKIATKEQLQQEIEQLKTKVAKYETIIKELAAPMIPSIVPNTMLVPLTGTFTVERFVAIQNTIVNSVVKADTDTVVIDLTGINYLDINDRGYQELSANINQPDRCAEVNGNRYNICWIFSQISSGTGIIQLRFSRL